MSYPQGKNPVPSKPRPAAAQRLAVNVKALRRQQRLTKSFFCLMSGISRPLLDAVENGEANPKLATLEKLAGALGVTESDLLE